MSAESPKFVMSRLKIPSVTPPWDLDAICYIPDNSRKSHPVIVMAHGWSANKSMGLEPYAEAFSSLGYACVLFDYRRWGTSDGTPRHCVYVSEQLDDYRTVIKYCRQQAEFDPQRVILWGSSFSGGHITTLLSEHDLNISAGIAQCPWLGHGVSPPLNFTTFKLILWAIVDLLKQAIGLSPLYIEAAGDPSDVASLNASGTRDGMMSLVKDTSDYPNAVSASSIFEFSSCKPYLTAGKIACPFLIIALEEDNLCYISAAQKVKRICSSAEVTILHGGHFEVYPGNRLHDASLQAQIEFLQRVVPAYA
ncbi:alpha/beta-hydrolase [Abortiporus biennis]|nr:alpha/beta-hydrolase [Abortiporus biennis]